MPRCLPHVPPPTASCTDTRSKAVVTLDQRRRLRKEAEVNYKRRPWHLSRELYDVVSQMRSIMCHLKNWKPCRLINKNSFNVRKRSIGEIKLKEGEQKALSCRI